MTGFNLPPGVSVSDLPGWDDGEYVPMHCSHCGGFVSREPTRQITTVTSEWCDGKVHETECEYEPSVWAIVKDVTDDKTYKIVWSPCQGQWEKDIGEHKPHWFEVFGETVWQVYCNHCHQYSTIDGEGYPLCDWV